MEVFDLSVLEFVASLDAIVFAFCENPTSLDYCINDSSSKHKFCLHKRTTIFSRSKSAMLGSRENDKFVFHCPHSTTKNFILQLNFGFDQFLLAPFCHYPGHQQVHHCLGLDSCKCGPVRTSGNVVNQPIQRTLHRYSILLTCTRQVIYALITFVYFF